MSKRRLLLAIPIALVALVAGGTWLYINVIEGDPPAKLAVDAGDAGGTTTAGELGPVAGTWTASRGSEAGYRVKEILFGQHTTAVGRTSAVTGSLTVDGTTVTKADFSVDMTTVASDQSRRDGQFHGRIMETSTYPTATFRLTEPLELGRAPDLGRRISARVTGDLTLHGVTKAVTFQVDTVRSTGGVQVAGSIPVVFADYAVQNPSNGVVTTEDHGELEFLLKLAR